VILAKKETQVLLDPKAVCFLIYQIIFAIIVTLNNHCIFVSIVDKGETGIQGLQGQKGDTVSSVKSIAT
jgi:hypothetical protein